ncbi:TetR/AcrR family transcriptional regulator [Desulfovibrio sulfodismutans]|uniref:TetR/AcrR family transcriptional regulator n=1 Tax=Desulfolutivibrio sulfodismutans TaxID=63561 RepID=A0A7K3NNK3_9BACT|nr:TetR family transcriptional regulator [Desulfolutivibrio sulfodismutans]NDY57774.1 TetR/AcrR family transcriptional regulator [Desulfolutivibrio sulfodismutans]QLA13338.1 TetR family transcriptional regulator [Desulfolutivibrio sulfodismutans DSM 3696]
MKISEDRKRENRNQIIRAAVDAMTEKGFKGATMREIARAAGLGDATIYNYFPTKEAIVYAYYEDRLEEGAERLRTIPDLHTYGLREQLQTYFETLLEQYLPDREFVAGTFGTVTFSLTSDYQYLRPLRLRFFHVVKDMFEAAVTAGEIPEQAFQELTCQCLWDYFIGLVHYWIRDRSEQFQNTTVLIDKSLDLAIGFIRADLLNKALDMASFLFRHHVIARLDVFQDRMDLFRGQREGMQRGKRPDTGGEDGRQHSEE